MLPNNKKINNSKIDFKISDEDKNTLFEKTDTFIGLLANYIIIFFIILSVIIVGLETVPSIKESHKYLIFITDFIISCVFLIEYIYRWIYSDEKVKYPFRIINILDLLSFLPFFILIILYGIGSYSVFALFRIFRVFRIFELIERIPIITKLVNGIKKHKVEYIASLFLIIIILTLSSSIVYFSEIRWGNKELFSSLSETFWWAIVTMTTTGYGDIIPASFLGKLIASILMILGPIIIAILSSITVIVFLDSTNIIHFNEGQSICPKCRNSNPINSKYCNNCGKKF